MTSLPVPVNRASPAEIAAFTSSCSNGTAPVENRTLVSFWGTGWNTRDSSLAGWPEAAMAGALAIRLSGPRTYDGIATDDPWLNPVAGDPSAEDIGRGLRLFRRAVAAFGLLLLLAWLV